MSDPVRKEFGVLESRPGPGQSVDRRKILTYLLTYYPFLPVSLVSVSPNSRGPVTNGSVHTRRLIDSVTPSVSNPKGRRVWRSFTGLGVRLLRKEGSK